MKHENACIYGRSRVYKATGVWTSGQTPSDPVFNGAVVPQFPYCFGHPLYGFVCCEPWFGECWRASVDVAIGFVPSRPQSEGQEGLPRTAHWFFDVIGAVLLGVATTELFLYLHRRHRDDPNSFKIFALSAPASGPHSGQSWAPTGMGVALNW